MQNYQLVITTYDRPGSVERILRIIRHRGAKIVTMTMQTTATGQLALTFNLTSSKPERHITNQLIKLADIVAISE